MNDPRIYMLYPNHDLKYIFIVLSFQVNTLNKFCRKTKDYCEPMKAGAPGTPGNKHLSIY